MVKIWCNVLSMEGVTVCGHHPECRVTLKHAKCMINVTLKHVNATHHWDSTGYLMRYVPNRFCFCNVLYYLVVLDKY